MTTILQQFPSELEDAIYSLAISAHGPDAGMLDELVRRYPQYAEKLTEIAVDLAIEALCDDDDNGDYIASEENTSPAVSRAMSRFNNRLHEVTAGKNALHQKAAATVENPFLELSRDELQSFASDINANMLFVIKVRDRMIDPDTMSIGFKKVVAEKRKAPLDVILAHFAGPQGIQAATHYKADQKPAIVRRQTFEDAVRSSSLTEEQQAYLLSL